MKVSVRLTDCSGTGTLDAAFLRKAGARLQACWVLRGVRTTTGLSAHSKPS